MMHDLAVSVLIVNWNARDLLRACLASLQTQTSPHEIIVVDNASTDDTVGMLRAEFPRVLCIASEKNLGFAAGNNLAANVARGRYLLLLNPDTTVSSGALDKLVAYADAHPDIGALGPELQNPDGSHQRSCWRGFPGLGMAFADALYLWKVPGLGFAASSEYRPDELLEPRTVDHLLGACMLIRRAAWAQVGALDENYFLFLEETDWCLRAQRAGWRSVYFPGASVIHFGQASMRQAPVKNIPQFYTSYLRFYRARHAGNALGTNALKAIIGMGCLIRIGMWRTRETKAANAAARELAREMTAGYRRAFSELGTY